MADGFYYYVGKADLHKGNIECLNTSFIIPRNNQGTVILVVYTVFAYLYSLIVLFVFYYLPSKSGFTISLGHYEIPVSQTNNNENVLGIQSLVQEEKARELIRAMKRGEDFLKLQLSPREESIYIKGAPKRSISQNWL